MKRTWALVPVKNLANAKRRLASVLSPVERQELMLAMAADVLNVLESVNAIERILLVSSEPEAGAQLNTHRAVEVFYSSDQEGLNQELEQAVTFATGQGATHVLIIHADLPRLETEALEQFIAQCPTDSLRLAADRLRRGTNALFTSLPLPLPLVFGHDSLQAFRKHAAERNLSIRVVDTDSLAMDIDRPEDLSELIEIFQRGEAVGPATAQFLRDHSAGQLSRSVCHPALRPVNHEGGN